MIKSKIKIYTIKLTSSASDHSGSEGRVDHPFCGEQFLSRVHRFCRADGVAQVWPEIESRGAVQIIFFCQARIKNMSKKYSDFIMSWVQQEILK